MKRTTDSIICYVFLALVLASCSGSILYYDGEMDRLVEKTGPGKLHDAEEAYEYCAEDLKRDRVIPKSLYLGACSGLEIMIIQNTIANGDPWKIREQFSLEDSIHPDFARWRPFYVKMARPYVKDFCERRPDKERCLSILN